MKIAFYTLGCKVNQYDTQMMRNLLEAEGHTTVPFQDLADCYIINTCSVTNMSDKKSRQIISRCKKLNNNAIIIVCGCYSQLSASEVAEIEGVDIVLGTANRKNIVKYLEEYLTKNSQIVSPADLKKETVLENETICSFDEKTRAIIKIEDGCQNFCSYCTIPFARGKIRSKSLKDIKAELTNLKKLNYQEVVLTGIHLASYGRDLQNINLTDAIELTCSLGFKRVRLGSLEPNIITDEFLRKISLHKNFIPSFHLSLQSGSDAVLKRMNRHYTTAMFQSAVNLLRSYYPNCSITTDIIVGFPGESELEFLETLKFVEKISFAKVHIFPYSIRKGTKAAEMPNQISSEIKNDRCKRLEVTTAKNRIEFMNKHIGKILPVLFEQIKGGLWEGYTESYLPVFYKSSEDLAGKIINVYIESVNGEALMAIN